jgi:LPXTG-motif cell wall-anchored protein
VLKTKTLEVTLGRSTSDVVSTVNSITSTATADGADIKILPTPEILKQVGGQLVPDLAPVVEIKVSSSKANAVYDRNTGVATPSFDAALVTVNINPTLAAAVGLPASTSIKPGVTQTILAGTPLQSTIIVADGSTSKAADGTVSAVADGVSVKLLQGLNASSATAYDGGIVLALAHSEANVVGVPATKVAPQVVVKPPTLPRTGGTPWIPLAGASLLGLALVARRLLVARD